MSASNQSPEVSDEMMYESAISAISQLSDSSDSRWISRQSAGRNYSSTSTVYAEHSIKNPNQHQVLFWYDIETTQTSQFNVMIRFVLAWLPFCKPKFSRICLV